jgi:hypothetical protein
MFLSRSKIVSFLAVAANLTTLSRAFCLPGRPVVHPTFTRLCMSTETPIEEMRAGAIKQELESYGISTVSFLEKKELVEALTKARADGLQPKKQQTKKTTTTTTTTATNSDSDEEGYAEYSNVEVLTDDSAGPRPKGSGQQKQEQASNPFGGGAAGANPFGAGGNPMGGMGGIADMLKNMGMGGAAAGGGAGAANPFGGAGGNPFGGASPFGGAGASPFGGMDPNAMAKAQQMMSNPKVQAIMAKAQSNPSIMKKVNECMSNPAAIAKYQNDPDVADLIKELQQYM